MMAERKRKVKWSLNPRGKDWSQNSNKFGQKILEKMGWSEGKGLGANEDGVTSHIRVAYKNDTQGMGYKERDDQWTDSQSDFTKLLNDLAESYGVNTDKNATEKKLESLELKSKTSKARVHYHKFTRGKDLSRHSEKDLAIIFGKKSLDEVGTYQKEGDKKENKENKVDKSFGVETHNGGNMLDYFKNKHPNFKSTTNSTIKMEKEDCDSDFERPSFGLGFGKKEEEHDDEKQEQPKNMRKNMSNGKSQPQDNFRKTCFGLGYDRYNDDETKPKSKFTSFVKATDTNEKKKPLKYGISKIPKQDNSENCDSSNCEKQKSGLGFNASTIGRIQSSFMSFVKGSVQSNGTEEDEGNVVKKKKDKKRKKCNDDSLNEDLSNNKKIKLHTDENNQGLLNINNTEQNTKNNIDEVNMKNEFKNEKGKNAEKNSGETIEENGSSSSLKKSKKNKNKATFVSFLEESNSLEGVTEENANKKIIKQSSEDIETLPKNGNAEESEKKSKKKKKKNGVTEEIVDSQNQSKVTEDVSSEKGQKRKSDSEPDVAFTPMKKKFKNFEDLHVLQDEEKIVETPKKIKKNKKSKQEGHDEEQGIKNPAFDPLHNGVIVKKKQLDSIEEETENFSQSPDVKEDSTECKSNKKCEAESEYPSSIKSQKKNKKKKAKDTDNSQVEENSVEDKSQKKSKKKKSSTVGGIDNLGAEDSLVMNISQSETIEDVSELNKSEKKKKKKKPKTVEGIVNLGLEDVSMMNESSQSLDSSIVSQSKEKKTKTNKKNLGIDNSAFNDNVESNGSIKSNEAESPILEKKKKKLKNVDEIVQELDNPCFSSNDSIDDSTVNSNKYEVKRSKKNKNLGIVNPALDLTSPPPAADNQEPIIEELPKLDDNLLLNVVCTPIIKKENNKKPQRSKSVRFSDANQSIFINAMDSPADLKKNGGVDNAAFDQFGNRMEENIGTLSKQLDDYQAEVENDLNEAKVQLVLGEKSDPDGENELLPNGDVLLRLKYARFGKMPHWMKKKDDTNAKTSYRHLIKGDITLGFKNTNMHLIKGYNTNLKAGT